VSKRTPGSGYAARSAARLAAVQALYQIEMGGDGPEEAIDDFLHQRRGAAAGEGEGLAMDPEAFAALVRGVAARRAEIDAHIDGALEKGWRVGRLERVLRAVLRAGCYELLAAPDVPARVVIDEYIEIAHAFFGRTEPALVNGVLDRLARTLRPDEFAAA